MGYSSSSIIVVCFYMFILASTSISQNTRCPFDFLYHLGDGVFDNGNAIAIFDPPLPADHWPYGITYPGRPTGRWSDGLLDIDYGAQALGFPNITAYFSRNVYSANAIIFAVARSPILDGTFFNARGIRIPPFAAPLSVQMSWFKKYINKIASTQEEIADNLRNSLFLFGDVEANDITYSLIQGKSIQEVQSYVPYVTDAQISAAREVIMMGVTRVILPGNAPIGCYPFVLTELASNDPADYDDLGCLISVNDLIRFKNNDLQQAIVDLQDEFPNTFILYADFYSSEQTLINETSSGPNGNLTVQACCGIGGTYNYDSRRFCESPGVPVCSDPNQSLFWDGIHLTQKANNRLSTALQQATLSVLNCTMPQLSERRTSIKKCTMVS